MLSTSRMRHYSFGSNTISLLRDYLSQMPIHRAKNARVKKAFEEGEAYLLHHDSTNRDIVHGWARSKVRIGSDLVPLPVVIWLFDQDFLKWVDAGAKIEQVVGYSPMYTTGLKAQLYTRPNKLFDRIVAVMLWSMREDGFFGHQGFWECSTWDATVTTDISRSRGFTFTLYPNFVVVTTFPYDSNLTRIYLCQVDSLAPIFEEAERMARAIFSGESVQCSCCLRHYSLPAGS